MKNVTRNLIICSCFILLPTLLNANENNLEKTTKNTNIQSTYIKKDKHNDRLDKRKEFATHPKYQDEDWYQEFKDALLSQYKTAYTIDLSYMPQNGAPNGGKTAQQLILSPYLNIKPFTNTFLGSGQIQFSYSVVQYWGENATTLQDRLDIGTGINDYSDKANEFSQLLYTHTMPGKINWLSVSVGQYSLYFIDGTPQDYNQQTTLISYSLSQNGSATYPSGSLGAYLQFTPTAEWMMQVGFQDANNISAKTIDFDTLGDGEYTNYMYMSWNPTFLKTWAGQYMFLTYNQPSTKSQPGDSQGWSFSFSQYFGNVFNIFGRVNSSTGNIVPIKKSIVGGIGFKDPFRRNPNDVINLGLSFNSMSEEALGQSDIHKYENVIEGQYIFGLGKYITITPDIQFFINPTLNTEDSTATVLSLRFGLSI